MEIFEATKFRNKTHDLLHLPSSSSILRPLNSDGVESSKLPVLILDEVLGGDGVLCGRKQKGKRVSAMNCSESSRMKLRTSRIVTEVSRDLSMSVIDSEDSRVGRPGVVSS